MINFEIIMIVTLNCPSPVNSPLLCRGEIENKLNTYYINILNGTYIGVVHHFLVHKCTQVGISFYDVCTEKYIRTSILKIFCQGYYT